MRHFKSKICFWMIKFILFFYETATTFRSVLLEPRTTVIIEQQVYRPAVGESERECVYTSPSNGQIGHCPSINKHLPSVCLHSLTSHDGCYTRGSLCQLLNVCKISISLRKGLGKQIEQVRCVVETYSLKTKHKTVISMPICFRVQ